MSENRIQPALIIGTGGSGVEVVRRFKRRFDEVYPGVPYVQVLGIDTAPQEELGHEVPELAENEFLYTAGFNMDFYVGADAIDNHPEVRHWWRGYKRLPLKTVKSGAGQKRPVGRLALYVHYDEIVQQIRAQVTELFNSDVFEGLPDDYKKSVNLYIVSSTCGGTGTGQFVDLAYVANETIQSVRPGINVIPRGLFFLPSAFLDTNQVSPQNGPRLRANAFGALTELDFVMNPETEASDLVFPGDRSVSRANTPYRSVYLAGNQTTEGKLLMDFHELMERAALHVIVELASDLTETGNARMDNVLSGVAAKGTVKGRGRSYSSFGEEWLELPIARLRARWQKRLAQQLIARLASGEGEAKRGFALGDSGAFGKLKALWTAGGLNRFMPSVETERAIFTNVGDEGLEDSEIRANANALESTASNQLKAIEPQLAEQFESAAAEIPDELRRHLASILKEGNLAEATELLSSTETTIRDWIARGRKEGIRDISGAWLDSLAARLSETRPGILQSKKKYAEAQGEIVLEASQNAREEWQARLKSQVGAAADRALPAVQVEVRELRDRLERVHNYLTAAAALLEKKPEPTPAVGTGVSSLSDDEIDLAYAKDDRSERLENEAVGELTKLLDLTPVTVESLAQAIWAAAGHAVLNLAGEYTDKVEIDVAEIASRVRELQPFAVFEPAWSANPARKDVERLRFLGLPAVSMGRKEEILARLPTGVRDGMELVPNPNPDRVVMTVQDHGFPLFALNEAGRLREAYEALDPSEKSLCFVYPDEKSRTWDYLPETPQEAKRYFGLGFVLAMIRQVGPRFVFHAGGHDDVAIPYREGADKEERYQNALDDFLASGHASEVRRRIGEEEGQDTPRLYRACKEWIAAERQKQADVGYPEMFVEIVDLIDQYSRSIES